MTCEENKIVHCCNDPILDTSIKAINKMTCDFYGIHSQTSNKKKISKKEKQLKHSKKVKLFSAASSRIVFKKEVNNMKTTTLKPKLKYSKKYSHFLMASHNYLFKKHFKCIRPFAFQKAPSTTDLLVSK